MANVEYSEYLSNEESGKNINVTITCCDPDDTLPFNINIEEGWYTEQSLNAVIKLLQKAKRTYKTNEVY